MSKKDTTIALFQEKNIRRYWDEARELWYFSIVDVIGILTDSVKPQNYWKVLKNRLKKEGSEVVTNCNHLKMIAADGKMYKTDCFSTKDLFRAIQSIPSPKAEPFKVWLAKVGYERIQEIENPEIAMERMQALYEKKGYSKQWIDKRMRGIAVRQDLTDEWRARGVEKNSDYAILTNEIIHGAFGMKVDEYKQFKSLKQENLRDHMTDLELILTMLGEATTTKLTRDRDSQEFIKLKKDATDAGKVTGRTRKDIEEQSGKKVISKENYLDVPEKQKRLEMKYGR